MAKPLIKSGKFHAGAFFECGENVTIDIAEEVVLGDRCVLPDNAYISGRKVTIGNDFYGYSWEWKRLDIGRGRKDDENAILTIGHRCTFHDNKIDLTGQIMIGDDVGLSPEVTLYTHYYWQNVLEGFPCRRSPIVIGDGVIIGYRSVVLAGACISKNCVIGAQSVVVGHLPERSICVGNPARVLRLITPPSQEEARRRVEEMMDEYLSSCRYRNITASLHLDYPYLNAYGCRVNLQEVSIQGDENSYTDDLREFLFKRGIRLYTQRPFKRLPRRN